MSKRKLEDSAAEEPREKKSKTHGFSVGPANLPDGTYRRKTQKIKNDLISKAKVKKAYAKLKSNENGDEEVRYDPYTEVEDPTRPAQQPQEEAKEDAKSEDQAQGTTNEIHPDRLAMLDTPEISAPQYRQPIRKEKPRRGQKSRGNEENNANLSQLGERNSQRDSARPLRYQKEFSQAEERRQQEFARVTAQQQRQKERKAMGKARKPGKDGKQRLGRQSEIMLSRVKRLMGKD